MRFIELPLPGSYLIDLEPEIDERGFFARFFCKNDYDQLGLDSKINQMNNSFSKFKGTIRGIHHQLPPKSETRIVRCLTGSLWDLILDLRKESPTFGKWHGEKISGDSKRMIYIPKGFGHGFMTLEDNTEVLYLTTESYSPEHERVIRWNDPNFGIKWPLNPEVISEKDQNAIDFKEDYHLGMETKK